jgi:hypothetical protein
MCRGCSPGAVRAAAETMRHIPGVKDDLQKSNSVIASAAKQSILYSESSTYGSPRRYAPRDDGLTHTFPHASSNIETGPSDGSAHAASSTPPADATPSEGGLTLADQAPTPKPRPATRASRLRASFPSVETDSSDPLSSSAVQADAQAPAPKAGASRRRTTPVADVDRDSKAPGPDLPPPPDGGPDQGPNHGPNDGPKGGAAGRAKLTRIK